MEKLTQDLFQDQKIEEKKSHVGGICATSITGRSFCITAMGADINFDIAP